MKYRKFPIKVLYCLSFMWPGKLTLSFIACILFLALCSHGQTDTLYHLGEKRKKGDTVEYTNLFRKFTWDVRIKFKNGSVTQYTSTRPDTLSDSKELDTVFLSASAYIAPGMRHKIFALNYDLEGSLLLKLNGQAFLETGKFAHDQRGKLCKPIHDDFKDILFTDSIQQFSITYLPYHRTSTFDLELKIDALQQAEQRREKTIESNTEDRGMGLYYLAFGIIFMSLFVSFKGKTEYLYFSLFCIFASLALVWDTFETDLLYNLDSFFGIFCFEFLSIFFYKILKNKEKSKKPLMAIVIIMAICFIPAIRFHYIQVFNGSVPIILGIVYSVLYMYSWISALYFLIKGIGQKRWEARTILIICFIPLVLFVLAFIVLIIYTGIKGSFDSDKNVFFATLISYLAKSIIYIYPLAGVYILGRRNRLTQAKLLEQVSSIRQLSEENLAKEKEKQHILEHQKEDLEKEVQLRTAEIVNQKEEIEKQHDELKIEKNKSDDLLRNILPEEVAAELKEKGFSEARHFDNVTVLFADFVDFTKAGEAMTPQDLVSELHICFKTFDDIISKYNIEKIKTIGDAYLAVCGLPAADPEHAEKTVLAAFEINAFMEQRQKQLGNRTFRVRIGIHSGSVVAGIVGVKKFAYDIWGDTVNTAARMEQNSEPGKINVSQTTYQLVKDKFDCVYRGELDAKNKGMMKMYFVLPLKAI